jgi:TolB-like protein/lipoprotein NlpI
MASVYPGLEYDIFISYRHNDNRSGGITEFVDLLTAELSATIKEPISVYFDKSAHDGLLESHSVDKSLEGKLKCLIFIPIISQTYCDPKSFAWQHEFIAFNAIAKEDGIGRNVKLRNGNVASRILPIKIHDLDSGDLELLETELGGKLRAIEFIYREPGVNRPLKVSDKKADNQNHTDYSNQINKVANAIKEIITAIQSPEQPKAAAVPPTKISQPSKPANKKFGIATLVIVLLLVAGYFLYQKTGPAGGNDNSSRSIAVMPFENMSGEADAYFTKGVTEDILTQISKIGGLRVLSRFTLKDYDAKGKSIQEIGKELGVDYLLTGSIRREGDNLRIACQLVQVNPEKETWAENFDKRMDDVFAIQHDVAMQVAKYLKTTLSPEQKNNIAQIPTENITAYNYYLKGREEYSKLEPAAMKVAIGYFKEALALDPDFALALAGLADAYTQGSKLFSFLPVSYLDSALVLSEKAVALNPHAAETWKALGLAQTKKGLYDEAIEKFEKAIELNPSYESALGNLGILLALREGNSEEWIRLNEQIIRINPLKANSYLTLGAIYMSLEMSAEAEPYFEKGLALNPRNILGQYNAAFHYATVNKPEKARQHIKALAAIDPEDAYTNEMAADIALNIEPALAREYLLKAVQAKGFDPERNNSVPLGIGYFLWQEGKIDSAKMWLDPILEYHVRQVEENNSERMHMIMIASNYAVRGKKKEALKWIRKAVDKGYLDRANLLTDFRLASIRKEPELIKMTEEIEKKLADQRLKLSARKNQPAE